MLVGDIDNEELLQRFYHFSMKSKVYKEGVKFYLFGKKIVFIFVHKYVHNNRS